VKYEYNLKPNGFYGWMNSLTREPVTDICLVRALFAEAFRDPVNVEYFERATLKYYKELDELKKIWEGSL
jgi:hypothetical protein